MLFSRDALRSLNASPIVFTSRPSSTPSGRLARNARRFFRPQSPNARADAPFVTLSCLALPNGDPDRSNYARQILPHNLFAEGLSWRTPPRPDHDGPDPNLAMPTDAIRHADHLRIERRT